MAYPELSLNQWDGIIPVILPVGPQTVSCIGVASAGVAVPFFFFLVGMFYLLLPIWLNNFHSDTSLHQNDPRGLEFGPQKNYLPSGRMSLSHGDCVSCFDGGGVQQLRVSGVIEDMGGRLSAGGPMMMSGPGVYAPGGLY
jgi:hypothetical protein